MTILFLGIIVLTLFSEEPWLFFAIFLPLIWGGLAFARGWASAWLTMRWLLLLSAVPVGYNLVGLTRFNWLCLKPSLVLPAQKVEVAAIAVDEEGCRGGCVSILETAPDMVVQVRGGIRFANVECTAESTKTWAKICVSEDQRPSRAGAVLSYSEKLNEDIGWGIKRRFLRLSDSNDGVVAETNYYSYTAGLLISSPFSWPKSCPADSPLSLRKLLAGTISGL